MIVLAGASASGKTEVAKMLAKKYQITKVITTTTRDLRIGEQNGVDYFFVSKQRFEQMLREDRFVEHTIYNGHFYGSTKDQIAENKCIVIDPAGLRAYIALKNESVVTFFLDSLEETRFNRMIDRGDLKEKAISRIAHDKEAFKSTNIPNVDFHVDSETKSIEEVTDIIYHLYIDELKKRAL